MRKSVLLRRIVLLILSAVLLAGMLSAGIYIFVTQRMYADMRANELIPIARTIADILTDAQQNGAYAQSLWPLLDRGNNSFGASLHIYNAGGESIMTPVQDSGPGSRGKPPQGNGPPLSEEDENALISKDLKTVLSGSETTEVRKSSGRQSYLVIGVPIEDQDSVLGAVFFTKPMQELSAAMYSLNLTLLVSTLAAFIIMLIPAYFATKRLVVPIRQMRDVARAMAKGDFSVRADESQKGEIGELGHSMNYFASESGKLEQTRRDFVANVSHELRTPIASIRAIGETLRDGMAKTEEKKILFYNNIVRESLRLSRLVDDLLELSRLQSGAEAMQKTRFDLCEVSQNISESFSPSAEKAGVNLSTAIDFRTPIYVYSNPDRIEQVLIILMDNAIKHTPEGGAIMLSAENCGGKIKVSVKNTGEGIHPNDLPHIFERFYKADKSHSGGGTGLGLSIAGEIIKGLGESIRAESADGLTRLTFTLSLPESLK